MSCWSLTAVKARGCCKQRLADELTPQRRRELVDSMLDHVIAVLRASPDIDRIAVVSPEHDGLPPEVQRIADPGGGLDVALAHAARVAIGRGATRLVIVHADLPWLTAQDIAALVAALRVSGIALAPDREDRGTNALCLALPGPLRFESGPGCFGRQEAQAIRFGLTPAVVRRAGLAFDVDEIEDLRRLGRFDPKGSTSGSRAPSRPH